MSRFFAVCAAIVFGSILFSNKAEADHLYLTNRTLPVLDIYCKQEVVDELRNHGISNIDLAGVFLEDYMDQQPPLCWYNRGILADIIEQVGDSFIDSDGYPWWIIRATLAEEGNPEIFIFSPRPPIKAPPEETDE